MDRRGIRAEKLRFLRECPRGPRFSATATSTEKLLRCWVEALEYVHDGDYEGMLFLECLDWRGRLDIQSYEDYTTFSAQTVQAIVSSVLGEVGLSLAAGSFDTSLTIDFEASPNFCGKCPKTYAKGKYAPLGRILSLKLIDRHKKCPFFCFPISHDNPM